MRKGILLGLAICIANLMQAQERIGLIADNYAGVHGLQINPAFNVNSPIDWDIHLLSAGLFLDNNYGFVQNASLIRLLRNRDEIEVATELSEDSEVPADAMILDFYNDGKKKHVYANAFALGPSARVNYKQHSFGFFWGIRSALSGNRIPSELGYYEFVGNDFSEEFSVEPFTIAGMTWGEVGLNYAREITDQGNYNIAAGITAKYLHGLNSFFIKNHDTQALRREPGDTLVFNGGLISYGMAGGEEDGTYSFNSKATGRGAAVDLGLSAIMSLRQEGDLKIGASVLDLGRIRFNKNTRREKIETRGLFNIAPEYVADEETSDARLDEISEQVFGDASMTSDGSSYSLWMPAGISLQADLSLTKNLKVNALLVRRLLIPGLQVDRSNIAAITPRFEAKWLALSLPLELYNDRNFRMGTALRLGSITVGSDNVLSVFKRERQFTGSDVYVSASIMPFRQKSSGNKRGKALACPEFSY